ncbi:hypothetical protein pb186bvf_000338 [Paramecium bursaria]
MKFDDIVRLYVTQIPRVDKYLPQNYSAQDIFEHYKRQAEFNELEAFIRIRFAKKFNEIYKTQDQAERLNYLTKEISASALKLFQG